MITTTLNKIRKHILCEDGWELLLKSLGKTKADDEPLRLMTILQSNGIQDAVWALRAVDGFERQKQLYTCYIGRWALPIWTKSYADDNRPQKAIEARALHAFGKIDAAARDAASAAASTAAWDAARAAASTAASAAAWATAWDAAWADFEKEFARLCALVGVYSEDIEIAEAAYFGENVQ